MQIALIAAIAENRVIGRENRMPWHLPADLRRFRRLTLGKPVVMGRRTHQSIGRPLPGRQNIVLTSERGFAAPGCTVVHSLEAAFAAAESAEIMVIGGAGLYQTCLPRAQRLYLTLIHRAFEGDTWFPDFDWNEWRETARTRVTSDPEVDFGYSFVDLERRTDLSG